jgi:hypothetical protein
MRNNSLKRSTRQAQQVYASLLQLYPADFRRHYANELTLLFVDMYRATADKGIRAVVTMWLTVLFDLLLSAIRERIRAMFNSKLSAAPVQKWGGFASFLLGVSFIVAPLIYLVGNLRDRFGPLGYSIADLLYGPVWAASLVTLVFALYERMRERAPRRMSLALLAAALAAATMVLVACIRSANRNYHLIHPELNLENNQTVLIVWTTIVAGVSAAGWHFLGWAMVLVGSAGWMTRLLPRVLSVLYLLAGIASLFVYLIPENEGLVALLGLVISLWQGIFLLRAGPGETQASDPIASQPNRA